MFLQACSLCCPSGSFSSSGADIWSARPLLPPSHPLIISSLSWLHFALLTCGDVTTFWQQTLPSPKHYTLPFFSENPLSVSAFNFSHLDQHFFFFKVLILFLMHFPAIAQCGWGVEWMRLMGRENLGMFPDDLVLQLYDYTDLKKRGEEALSDVDAAPFKWWVKEWWLMALSNLSPRHRLLSDIYEKFRVCWLYVPNPHCGPHLRFVQCLEDVSFCDRLNGNTWSTAVQLSEFSLSLYYNKLCLGAV